VDAVERNFGLRLKQTREQSGVSLRHIADTTNISVRMLEALERNEVARLPGGIYSRALVRGYAAAIGLNPEQTVREFIACFPNDHVTAGSPHVRSEDGAAGFSRRTLARATIALAAALAAIASFLASR
jgi:transcriptional regulator with XRE-family HTH domain